MCAQQSAMQGAVHAGEGNRMSMGVDKQALDMGRTSTLGAGLPHVQAAGCAKAAIASKKRPVSSESQKNTNTYHIEIHTAKGITYREVNSANQTQQRAGGKRHGERKIWHRRRSAYIQSFQSYVYGLLHSWKEACH
jgi:hypothetical protein